MLSVAKIIKFCIDFREKILLIRDLGMFLILLYWNIYVAKIWSAEELLLIRDLLLYRDLLYRDFTVLGHYSVKRSAHISMSRFPLIFLSDVLLQSHFPKRTMHL